VANEGGSDSVTLGFGVGRWQTVASPGPIQYRLGSHRVKRMIGNPNEALLPTREYARGKAWALCGGTPPAACRAGHGCPRPGASTSQSILDRWRRWWCLLFVL